MLTEQEFGQTACRTANSYPQVPPLAVKWDQYMSGLRGMGHIGGSPTVSCQDVKLPASALHRDMGRLLRSQSLVRPKFCVVEQARQMRPAAKPPETLSNRRRGPLRD